LDNRIFTEADCEETGIGCSLKGKVVVLAPSDIQDKSQNQLYYCTGGSGAGVNAHGRTVFMVNLENGEFERWPRSCITGVLKPELLPDQEKLQLSQIRPNGALPLESHEPQYSGYSFLENGRYTSGVWLRSVEEAMAYVEMQKPYQHRIMLCDRNDFCVWEVIDGEQIYPTKEEMEAMREEAGNEMGYPDMT